MPRISTRTDQPAHDTKINDRLVHFLDTYVKKRQQDLSELFDTSQPQISAMMTGRRSPSKKVINTLVNVYSLNLNWLANGIGEPVMAAKTTPNIINNQAFYVEHTTMKRELRLIEVQQQHLMKVIGKLQEENKAIIDMLQEIMPAHAFFKAKKNDEDQGRKPD